MPRKRQDDLEANPIASRLAASISTDMPETPADPPPSAANDSPAAKPKPAKKGRIARKVSAGKAGKGRVVKSSASTIPKRVLYTPAEVENNLQVAALLSNAVGGKLTEAAITRAMWSLLRGSEDAIAATRRHAPDLSQKPALADKVNMAEYEDQVAEYLLMLLKNS